jgi:hypothetical protein
VGATVAPARHPDVRRWLRFRPAAGSPGPSGSWKDSHATPVLPSKIRIAARRHDAGTVRPLRGRTVSEASLVTVRTVSEDHRCRFAPLGLSQ